MDVTRATTYTVRTWIKLWYEVYAEPRLREKTKDYYLNYIDKHIIPELGDIKLDKLTTVQIQKFYNDLQKNGRVQRYKHIELKNKGLSVRVVHGIHTLLMYRSCTVFVERAIELVRDILAQTDAEK